MLQRMRQESLAYLYFVFEALVLIQISLSLSLPPSVLSSVTPTISVVLSQSDYLYL
jgi:hypothetical protein